LAPRLIENAPAIGQLSVRTVRERGRGMALSYAVIPGRAEGANPEARHILRICIWIPGPALCAVPE
jgi:hypothetical protein